jgi:phage terminase large subunit-like protein
MRALSAESKTKEGLNSSCTVFDELHAQTTRVLWETLLYAGIAREQPLLIAITTAGWNKQTICWEQHEKAVSVLEGVSEDWSFLAVIYAASEDDDWTDPEVWKKANPSLGHTIRLDEIAKACKDAQDNPVKENAFKRYRLNLWTEQETRWLPTAMWDACDGPVDAEALVGQTCIAGLDLSTRCDITALVLLFRDDDIESDDFGIYSVIPYFWIPEERAAERARKDDIPYLTWARQGLVEMTPGNVIDYGYVKKKIGELSDIYTFDEIAADPWHATQLLTQLTDEGRTVLEVRQRFETMAPAMIEFEALIRGEKIAHGGNPVLRWMFSNLAVATNASGDVRPDKHKAKEKIDGITALLTALIRWIVRPAEETSAYDDYDPDQESDVIRW